jgi:hypothetical protein
VGAEAQADEPDSVHVSVGTSAEIVHDRRDDRLVVRPQYQMLLQQRSSLPRTVEREHVVAAGQRRPSVEEIQLLRRPVVTPDQHHGRPRPFVAIDAEVVARQRRALPGNGQDLRRLGEQRGAPAEHLGLADVGDPQPLVKRRSHEHHPGGAEVVRGPEKGTSRGFKPASGQLRLAQRAHPLRRRCPRVMPARQVRPVNPGRGR